MAMTATTQAGAIGKAGVLIFRLPVASAAGNQGGMVRRFLSREGKFLFEKLGVPDARTLLRRSAFWVHLYVACGSICGGIYAVYVLFGMAAMWIAVGGLFLFRIWLLNRRGGYAYDAEEMRQRYGRRSAAAARQAGCCRRPAPGRSPASRTGRCRGWKSRGRFMRFAVSSGSYAVIISSPLACYEPSTLAALGRTA
jgi:hypothetical protein